MQNLNEMEYNIMCLAIPLKVVNMEGNVAIVEESGIRRDVRLDLMEGVGVGDYVLVHAGFAIQKLNESEAAETLDLMREIGL